MITDYHAKYFACELTKRCSSDSIEKLAASLVDAQVDLNPHQVEAALFAFRSPLSSGAILADEVGLGKTIEAGIVISQKWAERKKRLLIIVPSNLRKQWNQELLEKFFIPSVILEKKTFDLGIKEGRQNPFDTDEVVICSYQFARSKADSIRPINWDLIVIDEAHRLRNVYKSTNKIANSIRDTLSGKSKLLLTATPLQNSLMELFGLVSFIDGYTFGDFRSFKSQFSRLNGGSFEDLKTRLAPICKRTLRRQVLEYIPFTNRTSITQEFIPSMEEQILYDDVSEYLQRKGLYALPASQKALMTLVLRKLLASSTFAIAGALNSLEQKLRAKLKGIKINGLEDEFANDFEVIDELRDEWEDENETSAILSKDDIEAILEEANELKIFKELAESITENAKGKTLLLALKQGFERAESLGSKKKAIIFTESRKTQDYLLKILSEAEYKGKIVLFNGSNNDPISKQIYKDWYEKNQGTDRITGSKTADMRSALVDYFDKEAHIMIATEAGAEGINLQFCSLVVNYDLPWNPQRIEQRIGRCHRYGQKHDVVVINFLNKANEADQRVYELLKEKFTLFDGVFGSSDEVLGSIESGVDFEKRILKIYQECRTPEQIKKSFDELQKEMETQIDEAIKKTRQQLLENFDEEVHEKLRLNKISSEDYIEKYEKWLWELTKHTLAGYAEFNPNSYLFRLKENPFKESNIETGIYKLGRQIRDAHVYRIGHPLARNILSETLRKKSLDAEIAFKYTGKPKISILEPLIGISGYLSLSILTITSIEAEDYVILAGMTDEGEMLDSYQATRLFSLPGLVLDENIKIDREKFRYTVEKQQSEIIDKITQRDSGFLDEEMEKLNKWLEDRLKSLDQELRDLDVEIKTRRTEASKMKLDEKLKELRAVKDLEERRKNLRANIYTAQDEIEQEKENLFSEVEARMKQKIELREIFTIKWRLEQGCG